MKKLKLFALLLTLCCIFSMLVACGNTESTSLEFTLNDGGEGYSVTGIGTCTEDAEVVIPSEYNGKPVTCIAEKAFYNCQDLTSITIPDSVTDIDTYALLWCKDLTSITFNGTKAQWNEIEKGFGWDSLTGDYTIHCTDGDISK